MARTWKWRRHDLSAMARQANHVLATAVVVFTAVVLLGRLLAPWMHGLQAWLRDLVGPTVTAVVFGPLIVDLPKALALLAVAFPLGRVTAPRPWPAALGLTLLVYAFDFSIDYVLGAHHITWLQWQAALGRGLAAAGLIWAVAALIARGRRAAETADRRGAALEKTPKKSKSKKAKGVQKKGAGTKAKSQPKADVEDPTCKQTPTERVTEGEA